MSTLNIRGVEINFPFEPYDIQKIYMEKVIECLQNEENGVLESPTGTGKTLSLLCSSLGWLTMKKAQIQAQRQTYSTKNDYMNNIKDELDLNTGAFKNYSGMPTIIYASRTHSQLTQAVQELKNSSYRYMKSTVVGSREQLCINSDVMRETNFSVKIHLCRLKVQSRTCHYYNKVEQKKNHPCIKDQPIIDIEDLVTLGKKQTFCPYYMSKELKQQADIVFMPYNYILDQRARKALGIELANNVIILDEAHNIEKICEDSASIEMKSTDITLCINEVTDVMKSLSEETLSFDEVPKDFTAEELCLLKEMMLKFEKTVDEIEIKQSGELTTFAGCYIFEMLKKSDINDDTAPMVIALIEKIVSFMSARVENGPFQRKGNGLVLFENLLRIVFRSTKSDYKEKLNTCYKVNVIEEPAKKMSGGGWLTKGSTPACKVLRYLCFNPGFGMNILKQEGIRCIILTSGTLAPLPPLISELDLDVKVFLENPHIVKEDQICVKILTQGPDRETLSSSYKNRDNINYVRSLGNTIVNVCRFVPNGLLIFFPSYPLLQKCQERWQELGIWTSIADQKPIFVEPKQKEAFQMTMNDYYSRIRDPQYKGAIFMGVCRGKISEGLDFADSNGRAVMIIGLPYPPLKDPKIILKKNYLNECNKRDKRYLTGDDWYNLEAMRAVNQAIGRVIRHRNDYGAIILLDSRFNSARLKSQLSLWLRDHIKVIGHFGEIIKDLIRFYRNAEAKFGKLENRSQPEQCKAKEERNITRGPFAYSTSSEDSSFSLVNVDNQRIKRRKIKVVPTHETPCTSKEIVNQEQPEKEIVIMMQKRLNSDEYKLFISTLQGYRDSCDFNVLKNGLDLIFLKKPSERYLIQFLLPYVKNIHRDKFQLYWDQMK